MGPQNQRKDQPTQRSQDKESKRARGALSCAECRRLKLKCDKTVPCSSCKRRGCSAICPNGSLITGQGTRFVLADTEKLHQKIAHMSDRIRQLEDALAILQSTQTNEPHPLLQRELLKIKSSIELHSAVEGEDGAPQEDEDSQYIDAFGTLAIRDDGAATFYGRSAGSESLLIGEAVSPQPDKPPSRSGLSVNITNWATNELPTSVRALASAFPLLGFGLPPELNLERLARAFLPPWAETRRLCALYLEQAPWFFGAVTARQLHEEILPLWYSEAPAPPTSAPLAKGSAHDLALLFVLFCFGTLTDMELPPAPDNPEADRWLQLTKAALTLEPVLDRPPSVATVQALSLMAIYEGLCSGENSIESTWALMGMATKLAQSIGLHRDCARWKLPPAEVQKRRALFWELFITDCWQSLATGRLATFALPFVDCELPFDPDQTMTDDGVVQPSFPFWKARFGAECVSAVVQGTLTSRAPRYAVILALDRKVRDMELPAYAQGAPPVGAGLSRTMSHFMPTNYRELTLLYIHRCFFAHALSSHPKDPIKSQYAPSFLAGYRSACTILASVKQQFDLFPAQIARFWVLWTHAFSAVVMLASVVTHSSQSKVAPAALLELRIACDLFQKAAEFGGRAVKFLPIIQRLQAKAQQVYLETNSGIPPSIPNDIFKPSLPGDTKDELSIFSGQTHTVTTKVNSPKNQQGSSSSASSRAASDSPRGQAAVAMTDNPSFAGVHPSLVSELNNFEGHIASRIQDAYHEGGGVFAYTHPIDNAHNRQQHQRHQITEQLERDRLVRERELAEQQHREAHELQRQAEQQQHYHEQQQIHEQREQYQRQKLLQEQQLQQQTQQLEQQQQLERQNQQIQTHRQRLQAQTIANPQYPHQYDQPYTNPTIHGGSAAPSQTPRHSLSHSQSLSNLHHVHQQHAATRVQQPQHSMYTIPAEYRHHPSPESVTTPSSATTSHFADSTYGHTPPEHQQQQYQQPALAEAHQQTQYWPATTYTNPQQVAAGQGQHHYTPEAALKGIAAEDHSLQETWQSYMYNVGSPRALFED